MNISRCLIVDDEPLACELLRGYVEQCPGLHLIATVNGVLPALEILEKESIDLIFLDVQMSGINGMQLIRMLNGRCDVILTTAYSEYAAEGFDLAVADYLVKPISFERFYRAVEKVRKNILAEPQKTPAAPVSFSDSLFVKTDGKIIRVDYNDILFAEGLRDYIAIQTATDRLVTLQNLRDLEELLPASAFMRVHKSWIVSLQKIDSVERNRIFTGKHIIPIGETYRSLFFETIGQK